MKTSIKSLAALSLATFGLAFSSTAFADCSDTGSDEWQSLSAGMAQEYDAGNLNEALAYAKRLTLICNRSPIVNYTMSEIYRKLGDDDESYNYVKRATEYIQDFNVPQAVAEKIWLRRAELELPYKKQLEDLQNQLATGTGEYGSRTNKLQNNLYVSEMKLEREKQHRLEQLNAELQLLNTTKWIGGGTAIGGALLAIAGGSIYAIYYDKADKQYGKDWKKLDDNDKVAHAGLALLAGGLGLGAAGTAVAIYSVVTESRLKDQNPELFGDVEEEIVVPNSIDVSFDVSPTSVMLNMTF